jgi:histidine triad (HIT) family protein
MQDCIFCKIASGDIPADKVFEDDHVIAFRDLNPQAPSHILVIPRKHIATLNDMQPEDELILGRVYGAARAIAVQEGIADAGYRAVRRNTRYDLVN